MFEDQTPNTTPLPASPMMPPSAPPSLPTSMPPASGMPVPPPLAPLPPSVHTMPERFRAAGGGGGPKTPSSTTKKLVIILIVVIALGGLGFGGLYVFQNVLNKNNANNSNLVVTNQTNLNTANFNTNVDLNQNANGNVNSDLNTNTGNLNANDNTNSATNLNTSTNTNTPVVTGPLPSSTDTDSDGLTDVEEAVYGTDASKADSDGDGFIDGKQVRSDGTIVGEVYLGYNPAGAGSLEGSALVKRQQDANKAYSLLVPSSWTVTAGQDGGLLITPTQQTGEFFQVVVNDNPNRLDAKTWYTTNNPSANNSQLQTFAVNGLSGVYSEDLSTAYIAKDAKVYSIQYNAGALTQVNLRTTFDMMIRSFKLVAS